MKDVLLYYIALVVTVQAAWNLYQDYPSVTGFYDHTAVCEEAQP